MLALLLAVCVCTAGMMHKHNNDKHSMCWLMLLAHVQKKLTQTYTLCMMHVCIEHANDTEMFELMRCAVHVCMHM